MGRPYLIHNKKANIEIRLLPMKKPTAMFS